MIITLKLAHNVLKKASISSIRHGAGILVDTSIDRPHVLINRITEMQYIGSMKLTKRSIALHHCFTPYLRQNPLLQAGTVHVKKCRKKLGLPRLSASQSAAIVLQYSGYCNK